MQRSGADRPNHVRQRKNPQQIAAGCGLEPIGKYLIHELDKSRSDASTPAPCFVGGLL